MVPSIKSIYSILAAAILLNAGLHAQAPQYNVTVLIRGAKESTATVLGLNNLGDVVGYLGSFEYQPSAFLYTKGIMMDLGNVIGGSSSAAYDINDKGQIVGGVAINGSYVAFIFSASTGVRHFPSAESAVAINNAEQILAAYGAYPMVLLPNGEVIILPVEGYGVDINDNYGTDGLGQVVGTSFPGSMGHYERTFPFIYVNGKLVDFAPSCYYGTTAGGGDATSINDLGQITANCGTMEFWYCDCAAWGGFVFNTTSESTENLSISGYYSATFGYINNSGWILGKGTGTEAYPLLYVNSGGAQNTNYTAYNLYDLIPSGSGITQLSPVAINNQGQIAANSNLGPVLLTPME